MSAAGQMSAADLGFAGGKPIVERHKYAPDVDERGEAACGVCGRSRRAHPPESADD